MYMNVLWKLYTTVMKMEIKNLTTTDFQHKIFETGPLSA